MLKKGVENLFLMKVIETQESELRLRKYRLELIFEELGRLLAERKMKEGPVMAILIDQARDLARRGVAPVVPLEYAPEYLKSRLADYGRVN